MIREQWSNPWFIGWSSRRDPFILTHIHTCTNICMPANTHAWRSPLSQPSSPACGKNTKKTHTCMLANQTEINPDSTVDSDLWNKQWIFGAVFYWNHCTAPFAFIKIPTMHLHDEREARWQTEDQSCIDEVKESLPCDPDVNINTHRADESITVVMTARRSQCFFSWWAQKKILWRKFGSQTTLEPIDLHCMDKKHWGISQMIF